jgi:hypothetical protein
MARHSAYRATRFDAHLVAGDAYVEQHGIAAIDFLKIDVEGAEYLVLKGLEKTMKEGRIHCVQFEYGAFSIQTRMLLADYYELPSPMYWIGKIFPAGVEFRDYDWTMECFRFRISFAYRGSGPISKSSSRRVPSVSGIVVRG